MKRFLLPYSNLNLYRSTRLTPETHKMPLPIRNLHAIDLSGSYIVETNVDIPLRTAPPSIPSDPQLIRANVYRPKDNGRYPVLVTYGPCEIYSTYLFDRII